MNVEKLRLWYGDEPQYINVESISKAALLVKENEDKFSYDSSGLEKFENGYWDEWLDDEDQNLHEHIFMYGKDSAFIDLDEEDDNEDDNEDEDEDEEILDDTDERYINIISASGDSNDLEEE